MGRATISGGGEDGLYTAAIDYDNTTAAATLNAIINELLALNGEVMIANNQMTDVRAEIYSLASQYNARVAQYELALKDMEYNNGEFVFYPPDPPQGEFGTTMSMYDTRWTDELEYLELKARLAHNPNPYDPRLVEAYQELMIVGVELWKARSRLTALQKHRANLMYRIEVLKKRQGEINTATQQGAAQSMWCADLTEDLGGQVDTIEIKGAPSQILIGPGGVSGLRQSGSAGRLAKIMSMSPAGAGLAWTLLPGWQKWRPTYRVGRIGGIDYEKNTANVTLDAARSIAKNLQINQASVLTGIPVEYMSCDAKAFIDGDRVVVEFQGQLQQGPRVIGFETNPQPCTNLVPAWFAHDGSGNFVGFLACHGGDGGWSLPPYTFIPWEYEPYKEAPEWLYLGEKEPTTFRFYLDGANTAAYVNGDMYLLASWPPYYLGGQRARMKTPAIDGKNYYFGVCEIDRWVGENAYSEYHYTMFCPELEMAQSIQFYTNEWGPLYHEIDGGYRSYMFKQYYIGDKFLGGIALVDLGALEDENGA